MAVESHSATPEAADGDQAPSHHPPAPCDELFDVSTTVDPGYIISLIRKLLPPDGKNSNKSDHASKEAVLTGVGESDGMETADYCGQQCQRVRNDQCEAVNGADSKLWEESGCILWDLSATRTHAEFMVENLVLEVLLANFTVLNSDRVKEICLGIIGNLACHDLPRKQIISTKGLVEMIVYQLVSDDTPCLCEVCRVITLGLQGTDCVTWAEALQSENILTRLLWIIENALNPLLIERSVQFLLAIIESPQEVVSILLPSLIKLGLPNLLIKLLDFELGILMKERVTERYSVLEIILSTIEALSVIDDHSQELSSSKELVRLLCTLIKLPDKFEVANCCVSAAVLIANILSDAVDVALELSTASSALWTVLASILAKVEESEMMMSSLHKYVSLLVNNSDHIEDSLLDSQSVESHANMEPSISSFKPSAKTITLRKIINMLSYWTAAREENLDDGEDPNHEVEPIRECKENKENVHRLLECCRKYVQL
uniref:ARM repeat superfamily protein n=1 Tax=Kalanchoe fedtschenkoi TaxID=63787 RepID=A0A7N0VBW7_KALFE